MKTIAGVVLAAVVATAAHAQPGDHFSLGAGIGFTEYRNGALSSKSPSVAYEPR